MIREDKILARVEILLIFRVFFTLPRTNLICRDRSVRLLSLLGD